MSCSTEVPTRFEQGAIGAPEEEHQHQTEGDKEIAQHVGIGDGALDCLMVALLHHHVEIIDGGHDAPLVLVIGLVMHHSDGFLLVGNRVAIALLHQFEGGDLGVDQGIRVVFGLVQFGEFAVGETGILHQVDQATANIAVGAGILAVGGDKVPVDTVVAIRSRLFAVAYGQDPHVLLLVGWILGDDVGAPESGQIIGGLAQFVGQQVGDILLSITLFQLFPSPAVGEKHQ